MNHGVIFGNNKCVWVNDDGNLCEIDLFAERGTAEFFEYAGLTRFFTNHKCIVAFCEDVGFELKKMLLNKVQACVGYVNFFVTDIQNIVFSGNYSIPKQKQVCLSFGNIHVRLSLFERGNTHKVSWIKLHKSQRMVTKNGYAMNGDRALSESERYLFELDNDQRAESLSREVLQLVKMLDRDTLDQGIVCFLQNPDENKDLLEKTEKLVKLPLICVNTSYDLVCRSMSEVVKDKSIFEHVIKKSMAKT